MHLPALLNDQLPAHLSWVHGQHIYCYMILSLYGQESLLQNNRATGHIHILSTQVVRIPTVLVQFMEEEHIWDHKYQNCRIYCLLECPQLNNTSQQHRVCNNTCYQGAHQCSVESHSSDYGMNNCHGQLLTWPLSLTQKQ